MGRFVKAGQTVVIKPNATWAFAPHTASSSDPDVLRAVIEQVQRAGAGRIIVMDHCSIDPGAAECLRINGIASVVKELGVEGIFPDRQYSCLESSRDAAGETVFHWGFGFGFSLLPAHGRT
jgi:uncharacterized protein (DUF362 family)